MALTSTYYRDDDDMALAAASAGDGGLVDVSELMAQGRDSAAALDALLQLGTSSGGIGRELVAEILRCCDRALAALQDGVDVTAAAAGRKRKSSTGGGATTQMRPKRRVRASGAAEMPARVEKKCTAEDGFMWRKYGQKGIQNSNYPRLYFRCTYKHDSSCPATKQVQRSEDDPSLYVITYFGEHTCCGDVAAAVGDGGQGSTQPCVINFGSSSATASSGLPWFSASSGDDVLTDTSHSSPALVLPLLENIKEELQLNVTKVESTTPDSQPATAELSSTADVCGLSPSFVDDLLPGCPDWDHYFGESSFDCITDFFDLDATTDLLQ